MIWICLLAAGSAQYLIHHRFFFFLLTFLPTYCTFIVVFLLVISCLMLYAVHGSEMALTISLEHGILLIYDLMVKQIPSQQ